MGTLDSFKAIVDDAFRDAPLNLRQDKAAPILSEAPDILPQLKQWGSNVDGIQSPLRL